MPLDDTALGQVTAQGIGELTMLAWLPDPGERLAFLPAAGIEANSAPADGFVLSTAWSGHGSMSLERRDGTAASRIFQTAVIDLPASQTAVGAVLQSGGYQLDGGQSATNLAVAATLNGLGNFGSIRP